MADLHDPYGQRGVEAIRGDLAARGPVPRAALFGPPLAMHKALNTPCVVVERTTAFATPHNVFTTFVFQRAVYDSHGSWTLGDPSRIYARVSGIYHAFASVVWTAAGGVARAAALTKNASEFADYDARAPIAGYLIGQNLSNLMKLEAGEYIHLSLYQDSGGDLNTYIDGTHKATRMGLALIAPL